LPKLFLPEGMAGAHKICGNSRGVGEGELFLCSKNGNSGEEIPSMLGVWILS